MKVVPSPYFESLSGKLNGKSGKTICLSHQTGNMWSSERSLINDSKSEDQIEVREKFTEKSKCASNWWNVHKPKGSNSNGTIYYQHLVEMFKAQKRCHSAYAYLRTKVQDDKKIVFGSYSFSPSPNGYYGETPGVYQEPDGLGN